MSDAARLASQSYASKPPGVLYAHFTPKPGDISAIRATVNDAVLASSYAAVISYSEAISGLQNGSISWSIVRLYYSCFYSLRSLLLLNEIVPFNCKGEMFLDLSSGRYLKGGTSSHHWNWGTIRSVSRLRNNWFASEDSQDAYENLRRHRENVNYTHAFTDPDFHRCLVSGEADLTKRFRLYRDDTTFLYTYLTDHLAIAYPTKLIFELDKSLVSASMKLPAESASHVQRLWAVKDRCPIV